MDLHHITTQEILERVSRHCPEALSTYLHCINRVQEDGTVFFSRQDVDIDLSEDWCRFRRNVKALARENLLSWAPFNNGIHITLETIA